MITCPTFHNVSFLECVPMTAVGSFAERLATLRDRVGFPKRRIRHLWGDEHERRSGGVQEIKSPPAFDITISLAQLSKRPWIAFGAAIGLDSAD
jgi:hypothetical protein